MRGEHLLLLTRDRLVVTRRTRLLRRVRLHLNAGLPELTNVSWKSDPHLAAIELVATASDGLRERFWIKLEDADRVRQMEALLAYSFPPRPAPKHPTQRQPRVSARHAA